MWGIVGISGVRDGADDLASLTLPYVSSPSGPRVAPMLRRLHQDGLRRSDHFVVTHRRSGRRARGEVAVQVGAASLSVRAPSSLYLCVHGGAAPHHAQRTVPPVSALGPLLY